MLRVYSEPNPIFIHHLKDLLQEKGIQSMIKNELLSGGVGDLPPTEVWPELWILDKEDKVPAERIIDQFLASIKANSEGWKCGACGEEIEGQFNICWRCGQETTSK